MYRISFELLTYELTKISNNYNFNIFIIDLMSQLYFLNLIYTVCCSLKEICQPTVFVKSTVWVKFGFGLPRWAIYKLSYAAEL